MAASRTLILSALRCGCCDARRFGLLHSCHTIGPKPVEIKTLEPLVPYPSEPTLPRRAQSSVTYRPTHHRSATAQLAPFVSEWPAGSTMNVAAAPAQAGNTSPSTNLHAFFQRPDRGIASSASVVSGADTDPTTGLTRGDAERQGASGTFVSCSEWSGHAEATAAETESQAATRPRLYPETDDEVGLRRPAPAAADASAAMWQPGPRRRNGGGESCARASDRGVRCRSWCRSQTDAAPQGTGIAADATERAGDGFRALLPFRRVPLSGPNLCARYLKPDARCCDGCRGRSELHVLVRPGISCYASESPTCCPQRPRKVKCRARVPVEMHRC